MKIKAINVKEFRRFHDLQIVEIPESVKLVIVLGPNGNGKSSLFDLMMKFWDRHSGFGGASDPSYYGRIGSVDPNAAFNRGHVEFHGEQPNSMQRFRKSFYFRSAYRNEPEMRNEPFNRMGPATDERRFQRSIDNDATVGQNYKRLVSQGFEDIFERVVPETTIGEFREEHIGTIRNALQIVFPNLELNGLGNPMAVGEFKFSKGTQKGYSYKNLSGGEKAAFDLILDIAVKSREFDDTVYCIDEPEAHLNPRVHGKIVEALLSLIGDECQLWLATHSVGMLKFAQEMERRQPGSVAFLDFDKDFDQPQLIAPTRMTRELWRSALSVALDDMASLVAPSVIVACESAEANGLPGAGPDAAIYNQIFSAEFPDVRFVSIGAKTDLKGDRFMVMNALLGEIEGIELLRLRDRDDMSEAEVADAKKDGMRVLCARNLETFLFQDDVLQLLCISLGQTEKFEALKSAKIADIENAAQQGHIREDLKKSAGRIMTSCKRILGLRNAGETVRAFMRDTLAPLIVPGTKPYASLSASVFGSL